MESCSQTRAMDGADKKGEQTKKKKKKPHVLVIPHCGHGHIIPAFLLSKELARQGIRVTLIGQKPDVDRLISQEDSEFHGVDLLQMVGFPRPDVVTTSPREAAILLWESFKAANMLEQLSVSDGPTCIVSDMFVYWATDLALQLQIPRYTFLPCGAIISRFLQATEDLFKQGTLRKSANKTELEVFDGQLQIPGLPALRYHELLISCQLIPIPFMIAAKNIMAGSGILMNTFYDLEASVVDTLRNLSPIRGQKFYPIGPLLETSKSVAIVQGLEDSKEPCIRWLSSQPESAVLYISFGTLCRLKPSQIKELALGLERSEQRFLWVLPHPRVRPWNDMSGLDPELAIPDLLPGSDDVLPLGFEARLAGRGYVVKGWAPQVQVLSHPSTAGFLTHCGWNSILEAVTLGVGVLAWPISAEQHLNCRYLVDELKVATEVRAGVGRGIVDQVEVERAVRLFMEEERMAMRSRTEALKQKAAAALSVDGSSAHALQLFAQDIQNL